MERWELPKGWAWKKLKTLITVNYGKGLSEKLRLGGNVPVYGANGVVGFHNASITKGQTIVIGRKGSAGAVNWSEIACWPIDTTFFIDEFPEILYPKFLYQFLRSQQIDRLQQSAAIPGLNRDVLYSVEVPIPYPDDPARSLAEQRRIVARLEALLGEVRALREEVQSMRRDLAQVMESALAEAFNLDEKTPKWSIATIANVKGGKRLPKGETFAEGITPYPYIRVTDFQDFSVRIENLHYLKPETYQKIRRYTISKDDVYISIAGTIGLVGIIPERLDGANLTENAAKIVFRSEYRGKIIPKYLVYFLVSPDGKKQIEERSKAAGQPKLALERIETIEIPEVDVSEQRRIVAYLERIAEETRAMDDLLEQDLRDLDALEQSILAAAFRGEV